MQEISGDDVRLDPDPVVHRPSGQVAQVGPRRPALLQVAASGQHSRPHRRIEHRDLCVCAPFFARAAAACAQFGVVKPRCSSSRRLIFCGYPVEPGHSVGPHPLHDLGRLCRFYSRGTPLAVTAHVTSGGSCHCDWSRAFWACALYARALAAVSYRPLTVLRARTVSSEPLYSSSLFDCSRTVLRCGGGVFVPRRRRPRWSLDRRPRS